MAKIKVGVLRGGPSSEYEISLLTGENVLKFLPENKYETHDILISKDGLWHMDGYPSTPWKVLARLDVAFNALHGEYGEDGKIQQILETYQAPYTGSGILASSLAMQKHLSRDIFQKAGIKTARSILIKKDGVLPEERAREIWEALFPPWVIKPASRGSSVGVTIAKTIPELARGLKKAFEFDERVLAEEYIEGREATCGILENFRGEKYYTLPVVEIIPPPGRFFDYEVKYNGEAKEVCPAHFEHMISKKIQELSILAHQALGLRHYSRSDFIVSKRGIFMLETNTLPGMTSESLFPKASAAIGLSFPDLLEHLLNLALKRK